VVYIVWARTKDSIRHHMNPQHVGNTVERWITINALLAPLADEFSLKGDECWAEGGRGKGLDTGGKRMASHQCRVHHRNMVIDTHLAPVGVLRGGKASKAQQDSADRSGHSHLLPLP
jgi:hypothetical protein